MPQGSKPNAAILRLCLTFVVLACVITPKLSQAAGSNSRSNSQREGRKKQKDVLATVDLQSRDLLLLVDCLSRR